MGDGLGGEHVEVPGHRVADGAVEALQGFLQLEAAGAGGGFEVGRVAGQGGDGLGAEDRLLVAVEVFAGGDDPVVGVNAAGAGTAVRPVVDHAVDGGGFLLLRLHALEEGAYVLDPA